MKHFLLSLLLALLALPPQQAEAIPAYPRPISVRQPDGRTVTILQRGDERRHWIQTTDGYTLLRDTQGYLTFARLEADGQLRPTTLRYEGTSAPARKAGIAPGLHFKTTTATALPPATTLSVPSIRSAEADMKSATSAASRPADLSVDATFPTTGKRKLLVLLVNFADTRTTYTQQHFHDMMNLSGYGGVGSFRDYYLEQSYGKLDIDVTVSQWITVPHNKAVYNTDNAQNLVVEALQMVADTLDLHQFDNDGDGVLDGLAVIHQGYGQEMSADDGDIWSHSTVVYGTTVGGVRLARYTIEPEMLAIDRRQSTIGVICHEFGHNLGAPDFYDTDYAGSDGEFPGTGAWDLMGSGAWNGDYGTHPAGINAFQKWVMGWNEVRDLETDTTVTALGPADRHPEAYRLLTTTPVDYFILENRQTTGATFDAALPGHGLVVYHVNEPLIRAHLQSNDINAAFPQAIYTVCADALTDPDLRPASFGNVSSEGAPFPSPYGHTEFSDATQPSTRSQEGRMAYRRLSTITEQADGTISFRFLRDEEPPHPVRLTAHAARGRVSLNWQLPDEAGTKQPEAYNVYRGTDRIARTTEPAFIDSLMPEGQVVTYSVDALWPDNRLSAATTAEVMVPANRATSLTAEATSDGQALISWETQPSLSRANVLDGRLLMLDDYTDEVEMANCYSPADLATCVGSTLTRMSFVSFQGPTTMRILLRVYEAEADGSKPRLVSERKVSEFAAAQMRDVKLTTPVTIRAGHTYYLAVNYRPTNGYVTLPLDGRLLTPGRGNLVMEDSAFVEVPIMQGNFFVQGTLQPPTSATPAPFVTPDFGLLSDAASELLFPLAFSVYCDNRLVGHTTGRSVTFRPDVPGPHTIALTSHFAGDNESTALTATVTTTAPTGIAPILSPSEASALQFTTSRGMLSITSSSTASSTVPLELYDLQGRLLLRTTVNGSFRLPLPSGTYLANGRKLLVP